MIEKMNTSPDTKLNGSPKLNLGPETDSGLKNVLFGQDTAADREERKRDEARRKEIRRREEEKKKREQGRKNTTPKINGDALEKAKEKFKKLWGE